MKHTMRSLHADRHRGTTAADAARRIRERDAADQAHREAMQKFSPLTGANFAEACDWQERRMHELLSEGGAK